MSKKLSKTAAGLFVLGGLAIFILGIVTLGDQKFFSKDLQYVLFFDGSVNGLSVGAPVVFRGVPLGNVTKISLLPNRKDDGFLIPVIIRLDPKSFGGRNSSDQLSDEMRHKIIVRMVQSGLRARLGLQSIITGQYRVDLDFFPDTTAVYRSRTPEMEIPTIPTPLDTLQKTLANMPIGEMIHSLRTTLDNIAAITSGEEIQAAVNAAKKTFEDLSGATPYLKAALQDASLTMAQLRKSTQGMMDKDIPESFKAFQKAMNSMTVALEKMDKAMVAAEELMEPESPSVRKFQKAMEEFDIAMRSMGSFARLLERNPEALIFGKGGKK